MWVLLLLTAGFKGGDAPLLLLVVDGTALLTRLGLSPLLCGWWQRCKQRGRRSTAYALRATVGDGDGDVGKKVAEDGRMVAAVMVTAQGIGRFCVAAVGNRQTERATSLV